MDDAVRRFLQRHGCDEPAKVTTFVAIRSDPDSDHDEPSIVLQILDHGESAGEYRYAASLRDAQPHEDYADISHRRDNGNPAHTVELALVVCHD